jgi:hypothetical protein
MSNGTPSKTSVRASVAAIAGSATLASRPSCAVWLQPPPGSRLIRSMRGPSVSTSRIWARVSSDWYSRSLRTRSKLRVLGEHLDDHSRIAHGELARRGLAAIHRHIGPPDIAGGNTHGKVRGGRPAGRPAQLPVQRRDDIDDHPIMRLRCAGHHLRWQNRNSVHQFIRTVLPLLPGEERVGIHVAGIGLTHGRSSKSLPSQHSRAKTDVRILRRPGNPRSAGARA